MEEGEEPLRSEEGRRFNQGGEIGKDGELILPPSSLGQEVVGGRVGTRVFPPAGVRVFSARNLQTPQEISTKTLRIEQIL